MNLYKADLHIHSILSPCGDLGMSPKNIVRAAVNKGLDIIAVSDHNSLRQCKIVQKEAENTNVNVFIAVEISTKEEIHCLAYFEDFKVADNFQAYIDAFLPNIKNKPNLFGYQVVVDAQENIVYEEEKLLITAIKQNINQIEKKVHELNGLLVPAHVDKGKYSLISQLGFVPPELKVDAFELSEQADEPLFRKQHRLPDNISILHNSDAHLLQDIGKRYNTLKMKAPTFDEFRKALGNIDGRKIEEALYS